MPQIKYMWHRKWIVNKIVQTVKVGTRKENKAAAHNAINVLVRVMQECLARGEPIKIERFGIITARKRPPRKDALTHPMYRGKRKPVGEQLYVRFRAFPKLRRVVNGEETHEGFFYRYTHTAKEKDARIAEEKRKQIQEQENDSRQRDFRFKEGGGSLHNPEDPLARWRDTRS